MESKTFTLGSELVQFYSRKSQVDFLLKSVLGHIWESQKEISLPNSFTCSLKESLSKLPGDTIIDIWTIINKEFLVHYNDDDEMVVAKFELAGELVSLFLVNIAVDNVPEKTANGINSQLKETTEYLFSHLKNKCLVQKCADDCVVILLRILLANTVFMNLLPADCTVKRAMQQHSDRKTESSGEFDDLSALYPHFTVKQWKKIHRLVNKTKDKKLLIVWEHLLVQSLKWCLSHATVSDRNSARQQQQQLCDYLILQKLEHLEIVANSEWNGEVSSVTEVNYSVAVWSLLCENLSWLLPRNSSGDSSPFDAAVARVLLATMLLKSSSTTTDDSKNISMQEVTRRFIKSSCCSGFSGMEIMQSSLLSAVLRSVSKLFNGDEETKPKRIKGHAVMDTVRRVLLLLEDVPRSDKILSDNGKVLWPSEELFSVVNELLQSTKISKGVVMDDRRTEEALNSLQILRDVLLPCMNNADDVQSNVDHVRCLVAAFAFLAVTPFSSSLFDVCLDVALRTLTVGQGFQLLLLGVDANHLLSFVCSISDYLHQQQQQQSGSDDLVKKADEIFGLVLRNVFRQPKSIQEFMAFIKKIISTLNNVKDKTRVSTNQALRPVARLVSCMESIHRILIRSYVRPDIRPLLTQVNSTLLEEFDRLLKEFCDVATASSTFGKHGGSGDGATSSEDAVIPFLLSGYVCQLDDVLRHWETEGQSGKDKEANGMDGKLEEALDMLTALCHGCMKCLRQSKNADVVRRCLEFINFICLRLRVSSKSLPIEFLDSIWTLLIDLLRQDLSSALSPSDLNGSVNKWNDDGRKAAINNETKSLEKTVAMVTSVFEMEEFERHVDLLLSDMRACSSIGSGSVRAVAALRIVQELTEQSLSVECQSSFFVSCQKLLLLVQLILSNCQETDVKIAILRTQTKLITLGPNFLESSELSLCLSSFADIDLEGVVGVEDFVALFNESYSMLNALLQYQETSVHKAIPTYLCVVKKLLRSIMKRSHQDPHKNIDSAQLNKLDECARLVYRLAHLMLEHKIDFAKVAPCLVAEYVTELQKGTLYPVIKQTLLMAVYQWLDICSDYATAHLHRVLPFGAKEIFGLIHEDFERYHRYKGRS